MLKLHNQRAIKRTAVNSQTNNVMNKNKQKLTFGKSLEDRVAGLEENYRTLIDNLKKSQKALNRNQQFLDNNQAYINNKHKTYDHNIYALIFNQNKLKGIVLEQLVPLLNTLNFNQKILIERSNADTLFRSGNAGTLQEPQLTLPALGTEQETENTQGLVQGQPFATIEDQTMEELPVPNEWEDSFGLCKEFAENGLNEFLNK